MSYQPLAGRYRPRTFAQMVGQEIPRTALKNAIALGREPSATLFTGVRGVGKTSLARLYAKALTCHQPQDGEPCTECDSCQAVDRGVHEDVMEIDGASHTGVDDIRTLKEITTYVPQRSRCRVYIIDEVHMLSVSAFNALLKILEEPPDNVYFIFATTEPNKVPRTVASRCQSYFLYKLPVKVIFDRLCYILREEQINYEEKAVRLIAREGQGSMRDAITLLDQVIAVGGGKVEWESLGHIVSHLSALPYLKILRSLLQFTIQETLDVIEKLDEQGASFVTVCNEVLRLSRHALVICQLGQDKSESMSLELEAHEQDILEQIARNTDESTLNRLFSHFIACTRELDQSALDRYLVENYAFEWCLSRGQLASQATLASQPKASQKAAELAAPLSTSPLENSQEAAHVTASSSHVRETPPPSYEPTPPHQPQNSSRFPASWEELIHLWKQKKPFQARKLEEARLMSYSSQRIQIAVDSQSILASTLLSKESQLKIKNQLRELFDFDGDLQITQTNKASTEQVSKTQPSILEKKEQKKLDQRAETLEKVKTHPTTQGILSRFGGEIVRTQFSERSEKR